MLVERTFILRLFIHAYLVFLYFYKKKYSGVHILFFYKQLSFDQIFLNFLLFFFTMATGTRAQIRSRNSSVASVDRLSLFEADVTEQDGTNNSPTFSSPTNVTVLESMFGTEGLEMDTIHGEIYDIQIQDDVQTTETESNLSSTSTVLQPIAPTNTSIVTPVTPVTPITPDIMQEILKRMTQLSQQISQTAADSDNKLSQQISETRNIISQTAADTDSKISKTLDTAISNLKQEFLQAHSELKIEISQCRAALSVTDENVTKLQNTIQSVSTDLNKQISEVDNKLTGTISDLAGVKNDLNDKFRSMTSRFTSQENDIKEFKTTILTNMSLISSDINKDIEKKISNVQNITATLVTASSESLQQKLTSAQSAFHTSLLEGVTRTEKDLTSTITKLEDKITQAEEATKHNHDVMGQKLDTVRTDLDEVFKKTKDLSTTNTFLLSKVLQLEHNQAPPARDVFTSSNDKLTTTVTEYNIINNSDTITSNQSPNNVTNNATDTMCASVNLNSNVQHSVFSNLQQCNTAHSNGQNFNVQDSAAHKIVLPYMHMPGRIPENLVGVFTGNETKSAKSHVLNFEAAYMQYNLSDFDLIRQFVSTLRADARSWSSLALRQNHSYKSFILSFLEEFFNDSEKSKIEFSLFTRKYQPAKGHSLRTFIDETQDIAYALGISEERTINFIQNSMPPEVKLTLSARVFSSVNDLRKTLLKMQADGFLQSSSRQSARDSETGVYNNSNNNNGYNNSQFNSRPVHTNNRGFNNNNNNGNSNFNQGFNNYRPTGSNNFSNQNHFDGRNDSGNSNFTNNASNNLQNELRFSNNVNNNRTNNDGNRQQTVNAIRTLPTNINCSQGPSVFRGRGTFKRGSARGRGAFYNRYKPRDQQQEGNNVNIQPFREGNDSVIVDSQQFDNSTPSTSSADCHVSLNAHHLSQE